MDETLQDKLKRIQAALHSGQWLAPPAERRDLVASVARSIQCREIDDTEPQVLDTVDRLARDSDWTVRLDVARMIHLLDDETCSRLVALFRGDCNRYVRRHAERSLARRRKVRQVADKNKSRAQQYAEELERFRRQHGPQAAARVVAWPTSVTDCWPRP